MRRFSVLALGVLMLLVSGLEWAQPPPATANPFLHISDTGQVVHVLPPPGLIRTPWDMQPAFAPASNGAAVYAASYGSGNLIDHGGLEIANGAFQAIYWNSAVANSSATSQGYPTILAQISAFAGSFATGNNWSGSATDDYEIVQQYASHAPIANTLGNPPPFVDSRSAQSNIKDSQIQSYLASLFSGGKLAPNSNTIYGVYFPAGMRINLGGGGASCSTFCGYHSVFTYSVNPVTQYQIKYAVFPYLNCSACKLSSLSVADMLTIVASHEIREAVTDPGDSGKHAWYDQQGYEADDKCAWHNLYQMVNGGFWVQPEFSNGLTVNGVTYPSLGNGVGACVVPK